jgi:hypothetical protein
MVTKATLAYFRKQLIPSSPKITFVGELIHIDVKRPFKIKSIHGKFYWILFVDGCSGPVWIYFLRKKVLFMASRDFTMRSCCQRGSRGLICAWTMGANILVMRVSTTIVMTTV